MPIYEYYCRPCNRIFSFLSPTNQPTKLPTCPKCHRRDLKKMVSRFAFIGSSRKSRNTSSVEGSGTEAAAGNPPEPGLDLPESMPDPRKEQEMERLLNAAENLDENDPRQLGRMMRKMNEIAGEKMDPQMEIALRRLEAGEDPDKIEADMGDILGAGPGSGAPVHDDGLYPM